MGRPDVLSDARKHAVERDAADRARALDDKLLTRETLRLTLEEHAAASGDARDELHIRCRAYAFEMSLRKLKEK
jgi:hypothetical protein